jgi:hypothetical protein
LAKQSFSKLVYSFQTIKDKNVVFKILNKKFTLFLFTQTLCGVSQVVKIGVAELVMLMVWRQA